MPGGLQWMLAGNMLVLGIILDRCLRQDSICTAEVRRLAALASSILCFIKFLAIHLVLATCPGNPPAVRVQTTKMVHFGLKPVWKPDLLHPGGANLGPVPVNTRVSPALATPISSNLRFRYSGIYIYGRIEISHRKSQNIDIGISLFFSDVLAASMIKNK